MDGGSLCDPEGLERRSAPAAGKPRAAVHLVSFMICAARAAGIDIVAQGRAPAPDRGVQHAADCSRQRRYPLSIEVRSKRKRMDSGEVERLIGVDVADAGHGGLIEQRRLHRPARPAQRGPERARPHRERIRAEIAPPEAMQRLDRLKCPQPAEAARVAEGEPLRTVRRVQHPLAMHVRARIGAVARRIDPQLARHAEVDAQHAPRRAHRRQLLAESIEAHDLVADEQVLRGGPSVARRQHVASPQPGIDDASAFEKRRQRASKMFDLWKFGHDRAARPRLRRYRRVRCGRRVRRPVEYTRPWPAIRRGRRAVREDP